jgi:hypothetical protein
MSMRRLVLVGSLLASGATFSATLGATETTPGAEPMRLTRGKPIDFRPGFFPAQVVCDDLAIVKVEDAGDHFRISGLKAGTTLCGFSSIAPSGKRRVLEIVVRE